MEWIETKGQLVMPTWNVFAYMVALEFSTFYSRLSQSYILYICVGIAPPHHLSMPSSMYVLSIVDGFGLMLLWNESYCLKVYKQFQSVKWTFSLVEFIVRNMNYWSSLIICSYYIFSVIRFHCGNAVVFCWWPNSCHCALKTLQANQLINIR